MSNTTPSALEHLSGKTNATGHDPENERVTAIEADRFLVAAIAVLQVEVFHLEDGGEADLEALRSVVRHLGGALSHVRELRGDLGVVRSQGSREYLAGIVPPVCAS